VHPPIWVFVDAFLPVLCALGPGNKLFLHLITFYLPLFFFFLLLLFFLSIIFPQ
jgi:hypothetical protein